MLGFLGVPLFPRCLTILLHALDTYFWNIIQTTYTPNPDILEYRYSL